MKTYPSAVSRTLQPSGRGLLTVVGQHDRPLSDADVNLIQDLQDLKRGLIVENMAPSGCLSASPFVFHTNTPNWFAIPAFDVLLRGEVIRVMGHRYPDLSLNKVELPDPTSGLVDGRVFVAFLEMWYTILDQESGQGFYVDEDGQRFIYPYGCVNADPIRLAEFPDDTVDPLFGKMTTARAQLQWRIQVQEVPKDYDFSRNRFGMDPTSTSQLLAQGRATSPVLPFTPLVGETGEATLWRAGGDASNVLGSMDGYVYAMPLAVVFQRSLNVFDPDLAPFGCASSAGGGLFLDGVSGRFDGKFADIICPEDVVDVRLTTSLTGYDADPLLRTGTEEILSGACRAKVGRSDFPAKAVGPVLPQLTGMAPRATSILWRNIANAGSFDGFRNGLSSDTRTHFTAFRVAPATVAPAQDRPVSATVATSGVWRQGDTIKITLPSTAPVGAVIDHVFVQSTNSQGVPFPLMGSQLQITGIGTREAQITIALDLSLTPAVDPGGRPVTLTVGTTYPAKTGVDLKQIPLGQIHGRIKDPGAGLAGSTFMLFGVSDYERDAAFPSVTSTKVTAFSPSHSTNVFGVRAHLSIPNTEASAGSAPGTYVFTIKRTGLDGRLTGLYVTRVLDHSGRQIPILNRGLVGDSMVITVQGPLDMTKASEVVTLCHKTAQASVIPAVRGLGMIEETVLLGKALTATPTTQDLTSAVDRRLEVTSVQSVIGGGTTIQGLVHGGRLRGIAGNDSGDQVGFVWVMQGATNTFAPVRAFMTITVNAFTITFPDDTIDADVPWFVPVSFIPGFDPNTEAVFAFSYVPYQGEGVEGRSYTILAAEDQALVTTNGTGTAPTPGITDVFPYDRQFPVASTLPSRAQWSDVDLKNNPIGVSESNFQSKRQDNTQVTFQVPLRTNDFVPPLQGSLHRRVALLEPTGHGFAATQPHVGFAIEPPVTKTVLGTGVATKHAITLYVDNVLGDDANDGTSPEDPVKTVRQAMALLPPILRHPVSVLLVANPDAPYRLSDLASGHLGLSQKEGGVYCAGEVAFTMQDAGSLTFGRADSGALAPPVIFDSTGFTWTAGPIAAFVVSSGRVVFSEITFKGTPAPFNGVLYGSVRVYGADVAFINCTLDHPVVGVTALQGARISWTDGTIILGAVEVGIMATDSSVVVTGTNTGSGVVLVRDGGNPNAFFHVNCGGVLTLNRHHPSQKPGCEVGFPYLTQENLPVVARAELGATIIAESQFSTQGAAVASAHSVVQTMIVGGSQFQAFALDATSSRVQGPF